MVLSYQYINYCIKQMSITFFIQVGVLVFFIGTSMASSVTGSLTLKVHLQILGLVGCIIIIEVMCLSPSNFFVLCMCSLGFLLHVFGLNSCLDKRRAIIAFCFVANGRKRNREKAKTKQAFHFQGTETETLIKQTDLVFCS